MPFDVEMPDGTVIQGVPEGTTRAQIHAKYQAHTAPPSAPAAAPDPQGILGQTGSFLHGINEGLYAIPQGAIRTIARGTDALGLSDNASGMVSDLLEDKKPRNKFESGGRFLGQGIGTAPLMGAGPLVGGALTGAALSEGKDLKEQAIDAAGGAIGGKAGELLTRGLSRVVAPVGRQAVQQLMAEGVRLTPGQIIGGGAQKFEDKLSSVPFVGDMISNARLRGLQDFNRAAINRSLEPIGAALPANTTGREAVDFAHQSLSNNYNRLLGRATFMADPQFQQGVVNLTNLATNIPQYGSQPLTNFIQTNIAPRLSGTGRISGREFKEIDEMLAQEISDYGSGNGNDRKLSRAFMQLRAELRDGLARTNPTIRQELDNTDAGFANLVRIENAAGRTGTTPGATIGTFSPAQLAAAVRTTDQSARKNAVARGNALMQDLSDAGKEVLPSQVPDSGTPGRIAAMLLAGGSLGHAVNPIAAVPIGALTLGYTRPGISAAEHLLARRPASANNLARLLRNSAPAVQAPAAIGASALASQLMGSGQ